MSTELAQFIQTTPLCDTHEHLVGEESYLTSAPDILQALFDNYVTADLVLGLCCFDRGCVDGFHAINLAGNQAHRFAITSVLHGLPRPLDTSQACS